ncbi:MAG: AraC family transcriptional regulator [Terracidiphilus sp.]
MTGNARSTDRIRQATPAHTTSVSVLSVRPVLAYLASNRQDYAAILEEHGISPDVLDNPEGRVPHTVAMRLWESAERLSRDPDLGLHIAEAIQPGSFGALDYAARTSATIGEGFACFFRYHRLLHDLPEVALELKDRRAILSHYIPLPGTAPRVVSEFVLAAWLVAARQATGADCVPLEVRFPHAEPASTTEHRRIFRAPLVFSFRRSELVFSREWVDLPMLKADPVLRNIIEDHVHALLRSLPSRGTTADAVRDLVARNLCQGEPTLEAIASRLHLSSRTLHRYLVEDGTSFRDIIRDLRRELALMHLDNRNLAIGEIAFLLGFSEPSAFHRAFKRWTGCPPQEHRFARTVSTPDT